MHVLKYFLLAKHLIIENGTISKLTPKGVYLNGSGLISKEVKLTSVNLHTIVNNRKFEDGYHVYAFYENNSHLHLGTVTELRENPLLSLLSK